MSNLKHWTLYVLKLEQGKYYVGITSQDVEKRYHEHLHGRKSYWTEKYTPIKILQSEDLGWTSYEVAYLRERRVTREFMRVKGINNVRGGDLTSVDDYTWVWFKRRIIPTDYWTIAKYFFYMTILALFFMVLYFTKL